MIAKQFLIWRSKKKTQENVQISIKQNEKIIKMKKKYILQLNESELK